MILPFLLMVKLSFAGILKDEKTVIEEVSKTVVRIWLFDSKGQKEIGTGFFISEDGVIATNAHLLQNFLKDNRAKINISNSQGTQFGELSISECGLGKRDICLLKVNQNVSFITPKRMVIGEGQTVHTIGNGICHGYFQHLNGILERKKTTQEIIEYAMSSEFKEKYSLDTEIVLSSIQFCNGDSGSPLFASTGDLIGMNSLIVTSKDKSRKQLNIAVSVNELMDYVERVKGKFLPIPKERIVTNSIKYRKEI